MPLVATLQASGESENTQSRGTVALELLPAGASFLGDAIDPGDGCVISQFWMIANWLTSLETLYNQSQNTSGWVTSHPKTMDFI